MREFVNVLIRQSIYTFTRLHIFEVAYSISSAQEDSVS